MYTVQYADRNRKLKGLEMTYGEYLKSIHWQLVKNLAARREKFNFCAACGKRGHIQLHHTSYKRIARLNRTEQQLAYLVALCGDCHVKVHELAKKRGIGLIRATKDLIRINKRVAGVEIASA